MCIAWKKYYYKHKTFCLVATPILLLFLIIVLLCLSTYIPKTMPTNYNSEASLSNKFINEHCLVGVRNANFYAAENTMAVYKTMFEKNNDYKIDIVKINLRVTADNKLIILNSDKLDNISDAREFYGEKNVRPENKTYAQLQKYNLGYYYKTNNAYPLREKDADISDYKIITLEQLLAYLETTVYNTWKIKLNYIIDIKYKGDLGKTTLEALYSTLKEYDILNRAVVGIPDIKSVRYADTKYPDMFRKAHKNEITSFYLNCIFGVNLSKKKINYKLLELPQKSIVNFAKKSIVDYAHKYGIAVYYGTVNKDKDISRLIKIGCDAVITDNAQKTYRIINGL